MVYILSYLQYKLFLITFFVNFHEVTHSIPKLSSFFFGLPCNMTYDIIYCAEKCTDPIFVQHLLFSPKLYTLPAFQYYSLPTQSNGASCIVPSSLTSIFICNSCWLSWQISWPFWMAFCLWRHTWGDRTAQCSLLYIILCCEYHVVNFGINEQWLVSHNTGEVIEVRHCGYAWQIAEQSDDTKQQQLKAGIGTQVVSLISFCL